MSQAEHPAQGAQNGKGAAVKASPLESRIAVVVNGNARNVTEEVISTLDQILSGGDLFVSRRLSDAREIAKTLVSRGYGTVLTGGGDGTFTVMVTEVFQEARRQGRPLPRFGLLKLGTGNALAWVVGARDATGKGLAADIRRLSEDAGSREIRLIEVEDFIAPFCGVGADAELLADYGKVKTLLGKTPLGGKAAGLFSYSVASFGLTLPKLMVSKMTRCRVINEGSEAYRLGDNGGVEGHPIARGEVLYEGPMRVAALSTIPYYGYGFRLFPFAQDRSDRMHLRITTISPFRLLAHFRKFWRGEYHNAKVLFDYLVDKITIELDPPAEFQIGGDQRGKRSRISALLSPTPIRLVDYYAPPSAY
jgi:diacylglycerol kinase family enzyme